MYTGPLPLPLGPPRAHARPRRVSCGPIRVTHWSKSGHIAGQTAGGRQVNTSPSLAADSALDRRDVGQPAVKFK